MILAVGGTLNPNQPTNHYKPMADNDAPGEGFEWIPGAWLAGFIKRSTIHCYTQNIKALCLVVRFFYVSPL